jgi:hypothetical protein
MTDTSKALWVRPQQILRMITPLLTVLNTSGPAGENALFAAFAASLHEPTGWTTDLKKKTLDLNRRAQQEGYTQDTFPTTAADNRVEGEVYSCCT